MRKWKIAFLTMLLILFCNYPIANADSGPKPTLDITVVNVDDSNYYLDLLGKEGEYGYFDATDGNEKYNNMHDQPIYKYGTDGWKAIHMRTWVLNGKLTGDPLESDKNGKVISMKHSFGYVGVPNVFKIIIQKSDGKLQVSDIIHNDYFNSHVIYDMKNNKVLSIKGDIFKDSAGINYLLRVLLTLVVEILIAVPFFYRKLKRLYIIAIVNVITQTLLSIVMMINFPVFKGNMPIAQYPAVLATGEIIVFFIEYAAYVKVFGGNERKKIAIYTLIANLASLALGFVLI